MLNGITFVIFYNFAKFSPLLEFEFRGNQFRIDREIGENHANLVQCDFGKDCLWPQPILSQLSHNVLVLVMVVKKLNRLQRIINW